MIRAISQKIGKEQTQLWRLFWSWLLPSVILIAIVWNVWNSPDQLAMLRELKVVNWFGLVICIALLPINLFLESYKWKIILTPVEEKGIFECIKIILSGRSLNVITPFGIGNIFARYISTDKKHRGQAVGGMFLDTFSGLVPTVVAGAIAFFYLMDVGLEVSLEVNMAIAIGAIIFFMAMVFGYFHIDKVESYFILLSQLTLKSALSIMGVSVLRYAVFTIQFICLFIWLGSQLPTEVLLLGIAWIFLIKTILPGLSILGDLVKRELSAILFFSFFTSDLSIVFIASFVIWLINIALPALVGVGFVKEHKEAL